MIDEAQRQRLRALMIPAAATLAAAVLAELLSGSPTGRSLGLAAIVISVLLPMVYGRPLPTLLSASIAAIYFAAFVPAPSNSAGALFMRLVPGLFALAPLAAVLRPVLEADDERSGTRAGGAAAGHGEVDHLLHDAGALTDASFSYQATLERVARLPLPLLADWVAIYELPDAAPPRRAMLAAESRSAEEALDHTFRGTPLRMTERHPLAAVDEVLRTGQPRLLSSVPAQAMTTFGRDNGERLLLQRLEPSSLVMVPLHARGRLLGAMVFARGQGRRAYGPEELEIGIEYCRRAALAVDNARLFDSAVSARAEAETARERLLAILDDLASGFIALDATGRVTHMNQAAEKMAGRSRNSLLGRNLWQELPPHTTSGPLARFVIDTTRRHAAATTEFSVGWTGEARWLEVSVSPSREGASLYMRDVTERRAMASALQAKEEELRQSQKMEAVGRLAGGVAHDFNNLLMSIAGYAELLMQRAGAGHDMADDIQEILRATERASTLTRQLLTYSRKQVHQPQLLELNTVVAEMQRSLLRLLGEDIILLVRSEPGLSPIFVDPGQVEQILLNLAVNSRDAMVGGGTLTIRLSNVDVGHATSDADGRLAPGRYVSLEVTDTGEGIDPSVIPHIFEPFFTTKASGKGTGLGLASVYGIVKQNHGSITVSSAAGRGTTFTVLFPAAAEAAHRELPVVRALPAPAVVAEEEEREQASGVILVAEDEASVRRFVCQVLRARGYTVLEARTGVEGVAIARRHQGGIDLVLTDVVMPEMGGRGLAERIMEERPGTRILFMSGYAEDEIAHHGVLASGAQLLEKPFSAALLQERVATVLEEPAAVVTFSTSAA